MSFHRTGTDGRKRPTRQPNHLDRDLRNEIVAAMAKTLHVYAFAELQDRNREDGLPYVNPGPGGDWMDITPPVTRAAMKEAAMLAQRMERDNGQSLDKLYQRAVATPGKRYRNRSEPKDFGYGFAMQALGHGVSWFDDNPDFPHKDPPNIEFDYWSDREAGLKPRSRAAIRRR